MAKTKQGNVGSRPAESSGSIGMADATGPATPTSSSIPPFAAMVVASSSATESFTLLEDVLHACNGPLWRVVPASHDTADGVATHQHAHGIFARSPYADENDDSLGPLPREVDVL